jgi:formylmethanofuran dehydrogenase subunit E-like metal-binding protein
MNDKEILEQLQQLKRSAWDDGNIIMVDFYINVDHRLRELIVVGVAISSLYNNTQDDNAWNAMYEALSAAGLV